MGLDNLLLACGCPWISPSTATELGISCYGERARAKLHSRITHHGLGQSEGLMGQGISSHSKIEKSWEIVGTFFFLMKLKLRFMIQYSGLFVSSEWSILQPILSIIIPNFGEES